MDKPLVKVAKELSVGTSTIVEHLKKNGYEVDSKPTSKITDAMYDILLREFSSSVAIKKQADEISIGSRKHKEDEPVVPVSKPKVIEDIVDDYDLDKELATIKDAGTKPPTVKVEVIPPVKIAPPPPPEVKIETPPPPPPPVVTVEEKPKPVVEEKPIVVEAPKVEPVEVVQKNVVEEVKSEPIQEATRPKVGGLKIIDKIDLNTLNRPRTKGKPEQVQKTPEKEQPKVEEKPTEIVPPVVNEVKEEIREEKKVEKQEPNKTERPVIEQKENVVPAIVIDENTPISKIPLVIVETVDDVEGDDDNHYRAKTPQLKGLKILGKINLETKVDDSKDKRKRKRKKTGPDAAKPLVPAKPAVAGGAVKPADGDKANVAGSAADEAAKKKRRRKRKKDREPGTGTVDPNKPVVRDDRSRPALRTRPGETPAKAGETKALSEREIDEKVRATMARVQGGGTNKKKKFGTDRKTRDERREQQRTDESDTEEEVKILEVTEFVTVSEMASLMQVNPAQVIATCMSVNIFVSINQRLEADVLQLVAGEFGYEVKFITAEDQLDREEEEIEDDPENLHDRAPIVTVMGHVDHGKTSLLDYIRKANVASGEAGGITQHIGAYEVVTAKGKITFLDTPGHEAFTAMRARGAKVTDIAVIMIAADDNVMPQTREAISHAQAAGVPMVFAINKIDKEGAKPERIKEELANMNILVEDWGGTYQSQDISAKKGLHIEELMEKILLQAELLELKANPNRLAQGTVLEASLDKGRGFVCKILVQNGTLRVGSPCVAGSYYGKVKAMFNEKGKQIKEAGPSTPVLVLGLNGAPTAGEKLKVMETEQETKVIAGKRAQLAREQEIRATRRVTIQDIGRRLALGSFKQLNIIVKADFDGSMEALTDSLLKLGTDTVQTHIVHRAVGPVTESDILLASASDAIIVAFNVRPSPKARQLAEQEGVQVRTYSIIYEAIDEIKSAIEGMLEPTKEEQIVCNIDVREVFKIGKVGTVAGCLVTEGKVTRNTNIRIIRDGIVVFPVKEGVVGELTSLKRFKDDVKEVKAGFECGLMIKNYNDLTVGDVIEGYEIVEVKQKLGS